MLRFTILILAISASCFGQRTISTFAGRDIQFEDDGKPGAEARIGTPRGVTLDANGNLFFTDDGISLVLRLDTAGRLSVLANSDQVVNPRGVAVDAEGNVYVADFIRPPGAPLSRLCRIQKIAPDGAGSTIAGGGSDAAGEDIAALGARLLDCNGLAIDGAGNLYVADSGNNRVRRIGRDGMIRTIAGNGRPNIGPPTADIGDGGPAILATLRGPADVAIDNNGGLLIADSLNGRIRRVDLVNGVIRTVAGGGRGPLGRGIATEMTLLGPIGVASAREGGFYLFDFWSISLVAADGRATEVTGGGPGDSDGGPASQAFVTAAGGRGGMSGMAVDAAGNLFLADTRRSRVRRIGPEGIITSVAGSSPYRFAGDGGPAVEAVLNVPSSLGVSPDGTVHVLELDSCRVRSIATDGVIRNIAGNGVCVSSFNPATSDLSEVAVDIGLGGARSIAAGSNGSVYVADGPRIRIITPDGAIRSIVNRSGQGGGFGDVSGPAIDARIGGQVYGMYVDQQGSLYFSDTSSNRVRKVTPEGVISTFAGSGPAPGPGAYSGDGGPAIEAGLSQPSAITGDASGNIYLLDSGNRRIRKVARDGVITTVPGGELTFGSSGQFGYPGMTVDATGNVYIADQANHRIRRVGPDGTVLTVAGTGDVGFGGDGGDPEKALLSSPTGLAIDAAGNLYIADSGNHRIRRISVRAQQ